MPATSVAKHALRHARGVAGKAVGSGPESSFDHTRDRVEPRRRRRQHMKFRVERDQLADAVAWTAKSLPTRPSVPVLAGVMMRVADGLLTVSGFDYEVSSQVTVAVQ